MREALYRKWRPKIFDDVIGQNQVVDVLKSEVLSGKLSHAYLFIGTRGTGKTTCARILAKAINCLSTKNGNPCLECEICKGIENGNILDVNEIDAASNNGVENIRAICEESAFTTSNAKFRIYIIDEVHMLSIGAFNALLKILEEPPSHVIFILATTEIHKIPYTIVSRCQRFRFNQVHSEIINKRIKYICKNENIKIENEACTLISTSADGSVRDALSILDQCASGCNNILTVEETRRILGFIPIDEIMNLFELFVNANVKKLIFEIKKIYEKSYDLEHFCEQLIEFSYSIIIYKLTNELEEKFTKHNQKIQYFSQTLNIDTLLQVIEIFKNAIFDMNKSHKKLLSFECSIIKICTLFNKNINIDVKNNENNNKNDSENTIKNTENKGIQEKKIEIGEKTYESEKNSSIEDLKKDSKIFSQWKNILEVLHKNSKFLYMAFTDSNAFEIDNFILIEPKNSVAFNYLKQPKYREKLHKIIFEVTGKNYNLGPYYSDKKKLNNSVHNKLDVFIDEIQKKGIDVEVI